MERVFTKKLKRVEVTRLYCDDCGGEMHREIEYDNIQRTIMNLGPQLYTHSCEKCGKVVYAEKSYPVEEFIFTNEIELDI